MRLFGKFNNLEMIYGTNAKGNSVYIFTNVYSYIVYSVYFK